MTKDDDMSWPGEHASALGEALGIAREEEASAAQVARLAAALAPVYGVSIAASAHAAASVHAAASTQAAASSAGMGASASAGATTAAGAGALAGSAGLVKVVAALLTTAALGTAGVMSIAPSSTPAKQAIVAPAQPRPAQASEAPPAPPAMIERTGEAPVAAPSEAASAPPNKRARANAPVEAQLLTEAHGAMASDAERALKLANEHRARFPHGALAAERELLAVRALEQLQRLDQARARIARARRELPRSLPLQRAAERLGTER